MPDGTARRVFIYGSCVSRDTFGFLDADHELSGYVARQSAISVGAPAAGVDEQLPRLESAFQDRMVRGDIAGNVLTTLERAAQRTDILLLDLVDERGGVVAVGGGFVSRLAEFWRAGGRDVARGCRHIPFGADDHFSLWAPAISRILERVTELGLRDRMAVLATPWADRLDDGSLLEVPGWMTPPAVANAQYVRYFDHLERREGVRLLRLPAELARSSRHHRWGPSPFHYSDEAYEWLAERIRHDLG